jgi:hypothetical protein
LPHGAVIAGQLDALPSAHGGPKITTSVMFAPALRLPGFDVRTQRIHGTGARDHDQPITSLDSEFRRGHGHMFSAEDCDHAGIRSVEMPTLGVEGFSEEAALWLHHADHEPPIARQLDGNS